VNISFSDRLAKVKPSPTLVMTKAAIELKACGHDVISLAAGEPDFDTPEPICRAACEAIARGETRYTSVDGTHRLKCAVAHKFKRDNGLSFSAEQITIGAGGKQVIANALLATLSAGDEVIIPAPYWVSYPDIVLMGEGVPVIIETKAESGFKMRPADLLASLTPRTKWLILNSPSNPTGAVYSRSELRDLADVLIAHPHVMILSDDMYETILFDGATFATMAQAAPELSDRILTINGVSKTYNMTGWRIGYGAGPVSLIEKILVIQSQLSGNPCSVSQAAAVEALEGSQDFLAVQRAAYQERRDLVVAAINRMDGLVCFKPQGAFYAFVDCAGLIGAQTPEGRILPSDEDIALYLLEKGGVAVVHGAAFGCSPSLRLAFAASKEVLHEACARIGKAVAALRLP